MYKETESVFSHSLTSSNFSNSPAIADDANQFRKSDSSSSSTCSDNHRDVNDDDDDVVDDSSLTDVWSDDERKTLPEFVFENHEQVSFEWTILNLCSLVISTKVPKTFKINSIMKGMPIEALIMLLSSLIVLTTTGPFKLEPKEKYKTKVE